MDHRKKLFTIKDIYNLDDSGTRFVQAMRQNIDFHREHCAEYNRILSNSQFMSDCLQTEADLHRIPPIPTLFYKSHQLFSMPERKMKIMSTTSGTQGAATKVGLDMKTCYYGAQMLKRTLFYHDFFSVIPTNYIILGYQPSRHNHMGAVKTAYCATFLAPAIHREYALRDTGSGYEMNIDGVLRRIYAYSKQVFPVRLIGFPAYLFFMMKIIKEHGIKLKLHPKSKILLGGGWKQHLSEQIDKEELYRMAGETLGIGKQNMKEIFAVVESNILYCACPNNHFHVPVYGRVLIRSSRTFQPVPYGIPGILNLLSPLVGSMPLGSILTDDIAVLHEGRQCGCGIESPYFEVLGRAGMTELKTCTVGANEMLQEVWE